MRQHRVWLALGGLLVGVGAAGPLHAQGFSVNEHGTCAMGRAGTGTADPCPDGSAIFFNPAGVASTGKGHTTISVGGVGIAPSGGFTADASGLRSDLKDKVYPVPSVYITHGFTDQVGAGIGLFAPYGLTTEWDPTSQARFLGYKSVIRAIYVQPTLAAKLGEYVQLGAGFDLNLFHVQLRQRLDLGAQTAAPGVTFANLGFSGIDFADVNLHGNATGVGYHVGAIFKPSRRFSIGARFMSRQKVTVDGATAEIKQVNTGILLPAGNPLGAPPGTALDGILAAQFSGAGPLQNQGGSTAIRMPEQIQAGIMIEPVDRLKLLADLTWQNWDVFDTLHINTDKLPTSIIPENFQATKAWRFGAEYAVSSSTAIRGGYLLHDAAEPTGNVSPNLPEGTRSEFTVGFGTRLTGALHVDLAYQYINQQDRRGRSTPYGTPDDGLYKFKAHLFGAHLTYTF
jgi:long-chain fatty acid transport protein